MRAGYIDVVDGCNHRIGLTKDKFYWKHEGCGSHDGFTPVYIGDKAADQIISDKDRTCRYCKRTFNPIQVDDYDSFAIQPSKSEFQDHFL